MLLNSRTSNLNISVSLVFSNDFIQILLYILLCVDFIVFISYKKNIFFSDHFCMERGHFINSKLYRKTKNCHQSWFALNIQFKFLLSLTKIETSKVDCCARQRLNFDALLVLNIIRTKCSLETLKLILFFLFVPSNQIRNNFGFKLPSTIDTLSK